MKEKFWDTYEDICTFIRDLPSDFYNRLICFCLRRRFVMYSSTVRKVIHRIDKSTLEVYLNEYDEVEKYLKK